jgi:hypothetical protein
VEIHILCKVWAGIPTTEIQERMVMLGSKDNKQIKKLSLEGEVW